MTISFTVKAILCFYTAHYALKENMPHSLHASLSIVHYFFNMRSLELINHNCRRLIYDYKAAVLEGVGMAKNATIVTGQDIISERRIPPFLKTTHFQHKLFMRLSLSVVIYQKKCVFLDLIIDKLKATPLIGQLTT